MTESFIYPSLRYYELDNNSDLNIDFIVEKCIMILKEIRTKFDFDTNFYEKSDAVPDTLKPLMCHSGNCISLSKLALIILKANNINANLIPTTIPKKYYVKKQSIISHCACCIYINPDIYIILDPAFYFINPIVVIQNRPIMLVKTYDKTTPISCKLINTGNKNFRLRNNQSIPPNTNLVYCKRDNDIWFYILRGIKNPDDTIGKNHKDSLKLINKRIYIQKKRK